MVNVAGMYSKERLENLQAINATYCRALRVGDEVQLGNRDDPMNPYPRGEHPYGRVHSINGPPDARVINVKLEGSRAGSWAHCDMLSINPYLTLTFTLTRPILHGARC